MLGGHKVDEGFAEALCRSWVSFAYDGCVSLDSDELHIG
jgi:hypothetical protein